MSDAERVGLSVVAWRELYRQAWWRLERDKDAIEKEQRRQARVTGIPPPGPNTATVKAKLARFQRKYETRVRTERSVVSLRRLRPCLPQRRPQSRRARPQVRRQRRGNGARSPGRLAEDESELPVAEQQVEAR